MNKKEVQEEVFGVQYRLIFWEGVASSSKRNYLRLAATYLEPTHYAAVVEERSVNNACGYPLCETALPPTAERRKAKYRVSISQRRVFDVQSAAAFCSVLHDQGGLTNEQKTVLARKENEIAAARTRTKPKAGGNRRMSAWQASLDESQLKALS